MMTEETQGTMSPMVAAVELSEVLQQVEWAHGSIRHGKEAAAELPALLKKRDELLAIIKPPRKRTPKPEKPPRKVRSDKGKKRVTALPSEAEIRAQARCINPTTGSGCGKLLSECECGK
ncbi:MAG: hypothetical protein FJY85_04425, partial [Deltaproteobacteria bacterium]|nr:hypothetical protein [Deltaproteobacteria bacterium]